MAAAAAAAAESSASSDGERNAPQSSLLSLRSRGSVIPEVNDGSVKVDVEAVASRHGQTLNLFDHSKPAGVSVASYSALPMFPLQLTEPGEWNAEHVKVSSSTGLCAVVAVKRLTLHSSYSDAATKLIVYDLNRSGARVATMNLINTPVSCMMWAPHLPILALSFLAMGAKQPALKIEVLGCGGEEGCHDARRLSSEPLIYAQLLAWHPSGCFLACAANSTAGQGANISVFACSNECGGVNQNNVVAAMCTFGGELRSMEWAHSGRLLVLLFQNPNRIELLDGVKLTTPNVGILSEPPRPFEPFSVVLVPACTSMKIDGNRVLLRRADGKLCTTYVPLLFGSPAISVQSESAASSLSKGERFAGDHGAVLFQQYNQIRVWCGDTGGEPKHHAPLMRDGTSGYVCFATGHFVNAETGDKIHVIVASRRRETSSPVCMAVKPAEPETGQIHVYYLSQREKFYTSTISVPGRVTSLAFLWNGLQVEDEHGETLRIVMPLPEDQPLPQEEMLE